MNKFILLFYFLSFTVIAEESFLEAFMVGEYQLIGQKINSNETYSGNVSIFLEESELKVRRVIDGKNVIGIAKLEPVLNGASKALRIRFKDDDIHYEETCLWRSDLDNYARISCYLYIPGKSINKPGLEALFIHHAK